jgi:hypothetical protein
VGLPHIFLVDFCSLENRMKSEKDVAEKSLWDAFLAAPAEAFDMIMDPNKKERLEEENLRKEVKASKKQWRRIRRERFSFLDASASRDDSIVTGAEGLEEKKLDEAMFG